MHINLSKQALSDEPGEPALTQQIMCTADVSSPGVTAQLSSREVWLARTKEDSFVGAIVLRH